MSKRHHTSPGNVFILGNLIGKEEIPEAILALSIRQMMEIPSTNYISSQRIVAKMWLFVLCLARAKCFDAYDVANPPTI